MPASQLQEVWQKLFGESVPSVPIAVLRQLIAHSLQERRMGKLKASVRKELDRLAQGKFQSGARMKQAPKLSAGTRLVREWNGQTILVEVLEEGFSYQERVWNSLSEIARHVTGTQWSGPRFFGLHKHG